MFVKRGYTVIELLVALTLGALVISLGAMIGFRHQRFHRDVVVAVSRSEQLDQLVTLMPISLRGIAPGEGDIPTGGARDTAIEFRATITTGVVCDSASMVVSLAPVDAAPRLASVLSRPEAGDTAWFLEASGPSEVWTPRGIMGVRDRIFTCHIGGVMPFGAAPRSSLTLELQEPVPAGASVTRITRAWRYSLYRASDGFWYLGAKEWNPALRRFNTIQPVAGSVLSATANGLRFIYLDSLGAPLPDVPDPKRVAAIEVAVRVDGRIPGKYAHAASVRDYGSAVISLRNRAK